MKRQGNVVMFVYQRRVRELIKLALNGKKKTVLTA